VEGNAAKAVPDAKQVVNAAETLDLPSAMSMVRMTCHRLTNVTCTAIGQYEDGGSRVEREGRVKIDENCNGNPILDARPRSILRAVPSRRISPMSFFDAVAELPTLTVLMFGVALVVAFAFEFINGFHDTANAVTTVIYTRTLQPTPAVIFSGFMNFFGVLVGGTAVAFAVVNLLPVDLLVDATSPLALAMVMSLLLAGVAWNLGTWYLGLPVSSSHTLIGSILGVGIANS